MDIYVTSIYIALKFPRLSSPQPASKPFPPERIPYFFLYNMAPSLNHPPGMTFFDDHTQVVNVDASLYYGGSEVHSRTRTYSQVFFSFTHSWLLTTFPSPRHMVTLLVGHPPSRTTGTGVQGAYLMMKRVLLDHPGVS